MYKLINLNTIKILVKKNVNCKIIVWIYLKKNSKKKNEFQSLKYKNE